MAILGFGLIFQWFIKVKMSVGLSIHLGPVQKQLFCYQTKPVHTWPDQTRPNKTCIPYRSQNCWDQAKTSRTGLIRTCTKPDLTCTWIWLWTEHNLNLNITWTWTWPELNLTWPDLIWLVLNWTKPKKICPELIWTELNLNWLTCWLLTKLNWTIAQHNLQNINRTKPNQS